MLPLTRSRNRARFFGIPFSPSQLFSSGEQGAWYDPSDYSTLFTDSAGTTPVTGVEQFVGLMLDKSKGLVLGNELSNAATQTLATATGTQSGAGWNVTATGAFAILSQPTVLTSARWYKIRFKWSGNTNARTIRFYVGGSGGTNSIYTAGTATSGDVTFYASTGTQNTNAYFQINDSVNGDTFYLEITSVRELPGNHAFQTSSAKRPKLAARYNLLTYSEEFDNAAWTKTAASITANTSATTDPLGGNTADAFVENSASSAHAIERNGGVSVSAISYVFSIYAKYNGRVLQIATNLPASNVYANFDLQNGVLGTVSGVTAAIASAGNGWYLCSITVTAAAGTRNVYPCAVTTTTSGFIASYTGDGTSGIYIWGADLRPASQATGLIGPTYQRVAAATVYDTAGFLPYLAFDGLDDSMGTNSIDFSAGDKMTVWAGVRKLSDATAGILVELSASSGINAGAFYLASPESNLVRYSFFGRGSAGVSPNQLAGTNSNTYLAPVTNVLTATGNISGDSNILRIDATQVAAATGDQGAGNFGNYPLYIGARNNANFFFNGWLTSLIIRGAQSTQSQIEATESWVAGKTGVQL